MQRIKSRSPATLTRILALLALSLASIVLIAGMPAKAQTNSTPEPALSGFGGIDGLRKMTNDFVIRIQKNPRTAPFFADSDVPRLTKNLTEQFCELLGGPCRYSGRPMKAVHTGMNVRTADFNALAEELQLAMVQAGVSSAEQYRLIALLAPMQRDVVGH